MNKTKFKQTEIKERLNLAIEMLIKKDSYLLKNKVNERTVSHKLAEYLQILFSEYNVDCEYNLKGPDVKRLEGIEDCNEQRKTDRIYPDIIIHKRNSNNNLLVIEIKTKKGEIKCDIEKLKLFTLKNGKYNYKLGVFINFNETEKPQLIWFQNRKEISL